MRGTRSGFNPGNHLNDYGLLSLNKPTNAAGWENELRAYGPLIVGGHIGAVRIIPFMGAGHYVVVVGVNAQNESEYYDPLRYGRAQGEPETQSEAKFDELAYDDEVYAAQ
jgi:Papain-like cysteine protease AvrRpt2